MELSSKPDIYLTHLASIEASSFEEFYNSVAAKGLNLRMEAKPDAGPYAGIEWLLPTAIVVFLSRSYFDAFLKEAGKDHYQLLKAALSRLTERHFGKDAPKWRIFSSGAKKVESEFPRYAIHYSLVADLGDGLYAKLLLESGFDPSLCSEAQAAFLEFLAAVHDGTLDPNEIKGLVGYKPMSHTILLAYRPTDRTLEAIDPMSRKA